MNKYIIQTVCYLYLTGCMLLSLVGCTDQDDTTGTAGIVPADISAGIQTRASNTEWDANDAIGITMVKAGTHTIKENTTNRLYKTDASGSGKFTADASQQIYFPQDGTEVNFKSYYPYKDDLAAEHLIPVDVSDQNNLPEIDLMTAEHLTGFSKESPHVSLHFYHRLTKLTFNISIEENSSQYALDNATLTIRGMKTTATYDLFNEQLKDIDNAELIDVPAGDDAASRTAIVLPREAGEGVSFTIQFPNGENYTALLKEDLELKAGHHYRFTLTMKKNELVIGVTIEDWEDGGTHSNILIIDTTTADSEGMEVGDKMDLYLKNENGVFEKISTYTYNINGVWNADPVIYWSNIPGNSGEFRASMIRQEQYNTSQMHEIFTSGNVVIQKNNFARFNLKRQVARVVFQLKSTDDAYTAEQLQKMHIILPDYIGGGELINGEFIPGSTIQDIWVENGVGDQNKSSIALIQEQTRSANTLAAKITSSDTGMTYEAKFNDGITFKAGYSYVLEIDLNLSAVVLGVKILPWEDGGKIDLTGKVEISGSLDGTPDFFKGKTIHVYDIASDGGDYIRLEGYPYIYTDVDSPGEFKWKGPIYWEDTSDFGYKLKLTAAYYADQSVPSLDRTISFFQWSLPANQTGGYNAYDLLWSLKKEYELGYVNMEFKHVMSKVVIEIKKGEGITDADLADMEIKINNLYLESRVNMVENIVNPIITGNRSDILPDKEPGSNYLYNALTIPQTISKDNEFITVTLKDYGQPFKGKLTTDLTLVSGYEHLITVTIEKTKISMSAKLQNWGTGTGGYVTIQ